MKTIELATHLALVGAPLSHYRCLICDEQLPTLAHAAEHQDIFGHDPIVEVHEFGRVQ